MRLGKLFIFGFHLPKSLPLSVVVVDVAAVVGDREQSPPSSSCQHCSSPVTQAGQSKLGSQVAKRVQSLCSTL